MKTVKRTNDFIERCIQLIVHMVIANKKEWFMKAKMKKKEWRPLILQEVENLPQVGSILSFMLSQGMLYY
jgi:hypothetical protein